MVLADMVLADMVLTKIITGANSMVTVHNVVFGISPMHTHLLSHYCETFLF